MSSKIVETLKDTSCKVLTKKKLLFLKDSAKKNFSNKFRICTHNPKDKIHEMFIYHEKDYFVRPHMHLNKTETLFIMKGSIDYIIFDKDGNIKKLFQLSDKGIEKNVYLRIKPNTFHSMIIKSQYVIFYEITSGPFYKKDTVFAKWYKKEYQKEYYSDLKNIVKNFKKK